MITLSTPPQELVKTILSEEKKAQFWLKKKYHGDRGYDTMRNGLLAKSKAERKTKISDIIEYLSPDGNRWMVFECAQYHKEAGMPFTAPIAFCYYETFGSVGAYMASTSTYGIGERSILHFTSHFFLRFCARLGVEMRSRWLVQKFAEVIPGLLIGTNGKDEYGRVKIDVRLPASIGRGILREDAPIIEIRSYLTDPELNKKQLRETELLRKSYETMSFEPTDVKMCRMIKSGDFAGEVEKEMANLSAMTGIDQGVLLSAYTIKFIIMQSISELEYIDPFDALEWKQFGEACADIDFIDFVQNYKGCMNDIKALYSSIEEMGRRYRFKKYNAAKVMELTLEKWRKSVA